MNNPLATRHISLSHTFFKPPSASYQATFIVNVYFFSFLSLENHKRAATYTLTNVVPQNHKLNTEAWRKYEARLLTKIKSCTKAFVLVGAVPSEDNWIVKNNVKRVNIPDFLWNAYCCVDNNDKPKLRGAASVKNSEDNKVNELTLDQLKEFLKIPKEAEGVLFDKDCTS